MPEAGSLGIFLAKAIAALLMPAGLTLCLLIGALILLRYQRARQAKWALSAAMLVMVLSSSPLVSHWAMASIEATYPPRPMEELKRADVAIVLGGGIRTLKPPRRDIEVDSAGNRVIYASRLFRAGKVSRVIVSGGSLIDPGTDPVEADYMRALLIEWGVPEGAILVERSSRTTYENALFSKAIWQQSGFKTGLLVTSAFHMPRALKTFRGQGMDVEPASTDVHATGSIATIESPYDLVPSGESIGLTTQVIREWVGRFGYWLLGRG